MQNRAKAIFTIAMLICLLPAAGHALTPYSQDFESLWPSDPYALAHDGWLVFGNVSSGTYFYRLEAGSFSETRRMTLVK